MGAFAVGLRGFLRSSGAPVSAELGFLFLVAELPLLLAHYGLDITLVKAAPSASAEVLLSLLGAWNGVYHWVIEWLELGWMGVLAWAVLRTGALPKWLGAWAALVAAGLGFNMVARLLALPEAALMPTYALFSFWMLATAISFLLVARRAAASTEVPAGLPKPAM
jgi:hypothetical protein